MNQVEIDINPGRVLFGLSRIGYTPASAICDIIDNSVMANANHIHVVIVRENEKYLDTRRGNVKEYLIIDDGNGMDEVTILKSLQLGSSDEGYNNSSLSKFGLGLKSATFSQGDELVVISGHSGNFCKYVVSLPKVLSEKKYFASKEDITSEENSLIRRHLSEGKGTIIKIGKVRKEGHPSIQHTVDELKKKTGVIYYYFIENNNLKIFINDTQLPAVDMLFTNEANKNGNLDENTWDGREVRWIEKSKEIVLDTEANIKATIDVTQLPHPPTFKNDERGADLRIRERYHIEAANYGFYVYRNKRLISWAEGFNGIIPSSQDLYSFRGKILVDDSADDVLNIDVKKSTLTLSDEANRTVSDRSLEYKRKSIKAWNRAKELLQEKNNEETNQQSNSIIDELEVLDTLPGSESPTEDIIQEAEKISINKSKEKVRKVKEQIKEDLKEDPERSDIDWDDPSTEEKINETALKGDINPYAKRIFRVPYTEDNALWEPYYDTDKGHCVRINKMHRFAKVLFDDNQGNSDLQVLFELFIHQLAVSEVESLKHIKGTFEKLDMETIQKILAEYRRISSEFIANMCRKLEYKLPPQNYH